MERKILEPQQKALEIKLNKTIFGVFAEIGAGQEAAIPKELIPIIKENNYFNFNNKNICLEE